MGIDKPKWPTWRAFRDGGGFLKPYESLKDNSFHYSSLRARPWRSPECIRISQQLAKMGMQVHVLVLSREFYKHHTTRS